MKRLLLSALAALTVAAALSPAAAAAPRAVPVTVDGVRLSLEGRLEGGVTSVALRSVLDAVGGWDIRWEDGQAVAVRGEITVTARPGDTALTVSGQPCPANAAVAVLDGRTYVPVRSLCEALGYRVEWDATLGGAAVLTEDGDYSAEDLYWLSRVISAESQGETYAGQLAVGTVVMNRVASPEFPDTVRGVVFDEKNGVQFEPVSNGTIYLQPTASSVAAARAVLGGERTVGQCLYFFAPALSQGAWIRANRTYYATLGCHRFYL